MLKTGLVKYSDLDKNLNLLPSNYLPGREGGIKLKITDVEAIQWESGTDLPMNCFCCRSVQSTHFVQLTDGPEIQVKLPLCRACMELPGNVILERAGKK
jgi:hypothetical protein